MINVRVFLKILLHIGIPNKNQTKKAKSSRLAAKSPESKFFQFLIDLPSSPRSSAVVQKFL